MSRYKIFAFIGEKDLETLVSGLIASNDEFVAPVRKDDIHVFDSVEGFDDIDLNFINTTFPAKKYFMPHKEASLRYGENGIKETPYDETKRVIFGIRPCDVNSLRHHDMLLLDGEFRDPYYEARRNNTLIISLRCEESGENCFCTSLGTNELKSGFDLLFSKVEGGYVVETGSEKGKDILEKNKSLFSDTNGREKGIKEVECKKELSEEDISKLDNSFHSDVWAKHAESCLSCCSCTMTCPNCVCFGFRDIFELDLTTGKRVREWQSCQLKVFTEVAGGHVFRSEREKRLKHRIYHQLDYFKKKFGEHYCVGCGRCISNCPTGIDMTEIIKEL